MKIVRDDRQATRSLSDCAHAMATYATSRSVRSVRPVCLDFLYSAGRYENVRLKNFRIWWYFFTVTSLQLTLWEKAGGRLIFCLLVNLISRNYYRCRHRVESVGYGTPHRHKSFCTHSCLFCLFFDPILADLFVQDGIFLAAVSLVWQDKLR
jgi:hypothetical protein